MPIPKPREKETKDAFISRCMSDLKGEFDSNDQRLAVCFQAWKDKDKKKKESSEEQPEEVTTE